MDDKDFFENGCFSPEWTSDTQGEEVFQQVNAPQKFKDKETLLLELKGIKQQMQEIRAKEWQLAKLLEFHYNKLVKE